MCFKALDCITCSLRKYRPADPTKKTIVATSKHEFTLGSSTKKLLFVYIVLHTKKYAH